MDSSLRTFLWCWIGLVIVGFGGIWTWRIRSNPITAWSAIFQYIYSVNFVPIPQHPQLSISVVVLPALTLYIFFKVILRVNKRSDDFMLGTAVQEAQALWLGVSLGFFFFFISTATSSDATINRAQDTSALASFVLTSLLYASKRRSIVSLHQKQSGHSIEQKCT